ncbi:hypothetical protein B0H13DRAFT_2648463 [Mycena leptocephala]|nr:hypothetical protein B0H13DRAFT_2648463 [Mycena leptocephala]
MASCPCLQALEVLRLGDGRLWSSIHVDATIPQVPADVTRYYPLLALETQLQRSANFPLDVLFEWRGSASGPHLLTLLEALVRHCNHWERLTLNKTMSDLSAPEILHVLSGIRGHLCRLRCLEISCLGLDSSGIGDIFAVAPQLQRVVLTKTGLSLPWCQLTHFRARLPAKEFLDILHNAPNLVDCGIDLVGEELPPGTPVAILPHLRRLFTWDTRLLQFLEAPNLEYLRVNGEVLAVLSSFLHRSGCRLKRLTLRHCATSPPTLLGLLRHAPALSHLNVYLKYSEDDARLAWTFRAMRVSGAPTDLCPRLTSVRIICDFNPTTEDYDSLWDMVKSRWNVQSLTSACIWLDQKVPRSVLDRFERLRSDGFDILLLDFAGNPLKKPTNVKL